MGIASLVSTGRREVLERLHSEIFNLWMDVLGEVKETLEKKQEESLNGQTYVLIQLRFFYNALILSRRTILTLYWDQPPPSFYSNTEDTPEFDRRKAVSGSSKYPSGERLFCDSLMTMTLCAPRLWQGFLLPVCSKRRRLVAGHKLCKQNILRKPTQLLSSRSRKKFLAGNRVDC